MITFKKSLLLSCVIATALYISTHKGSQPILTIENSHRKLQIKSFCTDVVKPFLDAIQRKFAIDKEEEEEQQQEEQQEQEDVSEEPSIDESKSCEDSSSLELIFSLAADNATEDSAEINPEGFQLDLYNFVDCRDAIGMYEDIILEDNSIQIDVSKEDDSLIMTCTDCFDNAVCNDIEKNYNDNSTCFPDESSFRQPNNCLRSRTFHYVLSESGLTERSPHTYASMLRKYAACSLRYFDLRKRIEDFNLDVSADIDDGHLVVQCSSTCVKNTEYEPCMDLEETFLERTLCFPEELNDSFIFTTGLFTTCAALENEDVYKDVIYVDEEYFDTAPIGSDNEDNVMDEINQFFECRKNMGAYDQVDDNPFPVITYFGQDEDEDQYLLGCADTCPNGAFCKDLKKQYTTEFQCVKRYACNRNSMQRLKNKYALNFEDGSSFLGTSRKFIDDVEEGFIHSMNDYIECRFQDLELFDPNNFQVSGRIVDDSFQFNCQNTCGTIPYCDALEVSRDNDSRLDHCYEQIIVPCEDCRVQTFYTYDLSYNLPQQDAPITFEYSVQSLEGTPVYRQYYGSAPNTVTSIVSHEIEKNNLKDLLDNFSISYEDHKLQNFCGDLTEYVGCTSNSITEINFDIPRFRDGDVENGLLSNQIMNNFPNLNTLVLGLDRTNTIDFPQQFFSIPNLLTLTLRGKGKLTGNLPTQIGSMGELKNLDLNQCTNSGVDHGLTGSIPTQILSAQNLRLIELGCNQLGGNIPNEFYTKPNGHKKLKTINLNDNNFDGSISNNLNEMDKLIQLSLARNSFTGSIPHMKDSLNLKVLDAQHNGFSGDLNQILILKKQNTKLEIVALNDNSIGGFIPTKIGRLTNLKYLNLQNNNLGNGIPSELALCTNLKLLLLGGNSDMNYDVPSELVNLLSTNQVTHDLTIPTQAPSSTPDV